MDFIFIGYHREALEILHPFILEFETTCYWSGQLIQTLEANLAYRNHIHVYDVMHVVNPGSPEDYPRSWMGADGFYAAIDFHRKNIPENSRFQSQETVSCIQISLTMLALNKEIWWELFVPKCLTIT
jgi:hypothetical protein